MLEYSTSQKFEVRKSGIIININNTVPLYTHIFGSVVSTQASDSRWNVMMRDGQEHIAYTYI